MPRKPLKDSLKATTQEQPSKQPLLQNHPWARLRSHPETTKELLASQGYKDLKADLLAWQEKLIKGLVSGQAGTKQEDIMRGVINMIDIVAHLKI